MHRGKNVEYFTLFHIFLSRVYFLCKYSTEKKGKGWDDGDPLPLIPAVSKISLQTRAAPACWLAGWFAGWRGNP